MHHSQLKIKSFSSCFNHSRPTCHFAENILVLVFWYSLISQKAFTLVHFLLGSFRNSGNMFPYLGSDHFTPLLNLQNTHWSESWQSMWKHFVCFVADYCRARGRLRVLLQWNILVKTFFKKSQWRHLLYIIFKLFFIDKSSWDSCSWRANVPVLPRSGPWAPRLSDYRWLDSDQQYHFVKVHALCNYTEEAIIVYIYEAQHCVSAPIYWTVLNIKLCKIEMLSLYLEIFSDQLHNSH